MAVFGFAKPMWARIALNYSGESAGVAGVSR